MHVNGAVMVLVSLVYSANDADLHFFFVRFPSELLKKLSKDCLVMQNHRVSTLEQNCIFFIGGAFKFWLLILQGLCVCVCLSISCAVF